jgi:hypothetical protein
MLLTFEEQEKSSSATAPSFPRAPCGSTELSHPQIAWEEHDQGGSRYGRLEELGYGSPLRHWD